MKTPVAVFAYDRAELLTGTLNALSKCQGFVGRNTHVFCDAPRENSGAVAATRKSAKEWCHRHGARLVLRKENLHFRNITEGLTELTENEGAAISLEDDHVPAQDFLSFLERCLKHYEPDDRVFQIAAYLPGAAVEGEPSTAFLPVPMPTGWATWRRAWRQFRWDVGEERWPLDAARRKRFDLGGSYPASRLMERTLSGDFASYFIRWYLAMFEAGGLALCSTTSLVQNRGLASGVHARPETAERDAFFNGRWRGAEVNTSAWAFPPAVKVDEGVLANLTSALRTR